MSEDITVADISGHKTLKTMAVIMVVLVIAGLGTAVALLAKSKHTVASTTNNQPAQHADTLSSADTSPYKLSACKSGATQTVGNAGLLVGTDLAPGTYTVKDAFTSADQGVGWSNIDIYAKQSDFKEHNDGNATDYIQPNVGETDHTTLKDGEYVVLWSDDAIFTCQ